MLVLSLTLALMLAVSGSRFGRQGFARLAALRLRGGYLALLACLAQVISMLSGQGRFASVVATTVLLALFCWCNRRHSGIWVATVGIALNMLVMALNAGYMPISPTALAAVSGEVASSGTPLELTKSMVLEDGGARLAWLGDRLVPPGPLGRIAAWSLGDLLLLAGVGSLLWSTMKGTRHEAEHALLNP